jgi:hypothetical protein
MQNLPLEPLFWKGETEYVLDNFSEALLTFKQFLGYAEAKSTPEYKNINYQHRLYSF